MAGPGKRGIQRGHQEATAEYRRSKDPQGKGKPLGDYLNRGIEGIGPTGNHPAHGPLGDHWKKK
jgi:hypothetical protein